MIKFSGLFEPWEVATGDGRMFKAGGLRNRNLPIPVMMRTSSGGHEGAETVARITKIENLPHGRKYSGEFLDPKMVPQVKKAVYLSKLGLLRPSVDLDRSFTVEPRDHESGKKIAYFTSGNVMGVTLVPMPAFAEVTLEVEDDDEDASLVASIMAEFAASGAVWDQIPIAPRDFKYDADSAVGRIAAWAGVGTQQADTNKYASMFLWRGGNQTGTTLAQEDFRLPIGDVINGQPYLVFHAIYAAAALLSGGHGGLPNIPDGDKNAIRGVINQIYPKMAKHFNDPKMHSPFVAGQPQQGGQMSVGDEGFFVEDEPIADVLAAYESSDKGHTAAPGGEVGGIVEMPVTFATATAPPASAFADPRLPKPTPLTVTEDGRVFGHLGKWGECHLGIGDRCVLLPKTRTDYQLFKTGAVVTAGGEQIRVGKITVGTGHAHPHYGIVPSREHYDNSGWCAAVVNIGEDQFGVWVAGVVTDTEKIPELRRSPLSGDWRRYNGNLELVAALAVNNPGFPVFHQIESEEFSLVAAGMVEWNTGGVRGRDITEEVPSSMPGFALVDYDQIADEVSEALVAASQQRSARWDALEQQGRAGRLRKMLGEFAAMPTAPAPMAAPMPPAAPAAPAAPPAPAGQGMPQQGDVDPNGDPDSDPATPGIAEMDDPGRDTLLARMAENNVMIVNEETGKEEEPGPFLYREAQESATPKDQQPEQGQQPATQTQQAQPMQAQPQQQPAPTPAVQPPQQ